MRRVRALAAIPALALLAACSSGRGHAAHTSSHRPPAPKMDTVSGALSIKGVDGIRLTRMSQLKQGHPCSTTDGYSDIAAGAQVVISDDSGRTLTIVPLGGGRFDAALQCTFHFRARVPAGRGFYGVEVSHRGVVKEPERALSDLQLTLG